MNKAIKALKEYGLITGAKITQTDKGDRVDFTFNLDYDKQDETVLLPGDVEVNPSSSEKADEQPGELFPAEEGSPGE